jgi:hypothetical protein
MVSILWTGHARDNILKRQILEEWVIETIHNPDWVMVDPKYTFRTRAFRRIAGFGNRVLRVVYEEEQDKIIIVTIVWDRNAGRRA